jgi:exoribonuclease-2
MARACPPTESTRQLLKLRAEGRLERGFQDLDVGDHVRVEVIRLDVERGFIDFARI